VSTISSTAVVLAEDPAERAEAMAVGGFLAGYIGATRTSYGDGGRRRRPPESLSLEGTAARFDG
jgi:hypothetical protein